MGLRIDWKFIVGSALALVGLAIPLYLWQVDLSSHSLSLKLVSSSALQPPSSTQFQDLQVTLNGKEISSPYLSSFEMVNTGSKPILSSDFESSIEIQGIDNVQLVSAQVTGTDPKDIPVKILIDSNRLKIAPFLSNPNDIVSFSVITGEAPPAFKVNARIAGVKELVIEDSSTKKARVSKIIINGVIAIVALFLYLAYGFTAIFNKQTYVHRPAGLVTAAICLFAGVSFAARAFDELGVMTGLLSDIKIQGAIMLATFLLIWIPFRKWWKHERFRRFPRNAP